MTPEEAWVKVERERLIADIRHSLNHELREALISLQGEPNVEMAISRIYRAAQFLDNLK